MGSFDGIRFASKAAKIWGGGNCPPVRDHIPTVLKYMHHEPCWWAPKRNRAHFLSNHILADKAEHMQTVDTRHVPYDLYIRK